MTAHAMSGDRDKSLDAGMNDHLTKPINPQLLYEALDTWLPGKESAPAKEASKEASKEVSKEVSPDAAAAPEPVIVSPVEAPALPETGEQLSPAPVVAPAQVPEQDMLFSLKGLDARAGLSNVAGNRELYLRLLDRFAKNYRNSGVELRAALQRMAHDAAAHEEAMRLAHTAKGVAANLGARVLAAVAGELESAIKKHAVQDEMLVRYDLLLREALDSIESLPKREDARVGQKAVSAADRDRIAAVLAVLPILMQADWYGAQQRLLALASLVEGTMVSTHYRDITLALEEFDSEGVEEKGSLLLAAIDEQGEAV
jgi:HPt (histidine-containing phosphotransfer) domain-containing protein